MLPLIPCVLIGFVAGLRTLTPPAAVSWAAAAGWLDLSGTVLAFLGYWGAPWITAAMALAELAADKSPSMPSRKTPFSFASRVGSGALCGAALGAGSGLLVAGALAGAAGALLGTLGGYAARMRLAAILGRDWPAALLEDAVTLTAALLIVTL